MTVFKTWYSHFKYQVISFGLSNAPATFQRYINKILAEKFDFFVIVYLDNILIYTKDPRQPHVEAMRWVLDQLQKHSLFANLKKCQFHQDEVRFLEYVVLSKKINIEAERIEVVKNWLEPKSVRDIEVFLGFANFYWQLIQGFNRIEARLTLMLKTTNEPAPSKNDGSRSASNRNDDSKSVFKRHDGNGEFDRFGGDGVEYAKKSGKSKGQKTSKSQKSVKSGKNSSKSRNSPNFGVTETGLSFLTPGAREAFNRLRLTFTKFLIP